MMQRFHQNPRIPPVCSLCYQPSIIWSDISMFITLILNIRLVPTTLHPPGRGTNVQTSFQTNCCLFWSCNACSTFLGSTTDTIQLVLVMSWKLVCLPPILLPSFILPITFFGGWFLPIHAKGISSESSLTCSNIVSSSIWYAVLTPM